MTNKQGMIWNIRRERWGGGEKGFKGRKYNQTIHVWQYNDQTSYSVQLVYANKTIIDRLNTTRLCKLKFHGKH